MNNINIFKNIPKIFHCYWNYNNFSYLNYLTILSFHKHNPDWIFKLYRPITKNDNISWSTAENKDKYTGKDYFYKLEKYNKNKKNKKGINIEIIEIDFDEIGFMNNASDVIKSDYLRYYLLFIYGGLWSDMDVLYIKPIISITYNNIYGNINEINTIITYGGHQDKYFPIGLLMSSQYNSFFANLIIKCLENYDPKHYQTLGSTMIKKIYNNIENIKHTHDDLNIFSFNLYSYLPFEWYDTDKIFNNINMEYIKEYTVGIHWFNGTKIAKDFQNNFDRNIYNKNCTIYNFIKQYIDN